MILKIYVYVTFFNNARQLVPFFDVGFVLTHSEKKKKDIFACLINYIEDNSNDFILCLTKYFEVKSSDSNLRISRKIHQIFFLLH